MHTTERDTGDTTADKFKPEALRFCGRSISILRLKRIHRLTDFFVSFASSDFSLSAFAPSIAPRFCWRNEHVRIRLQFAAQVGVQVQARKWPVIRPVRQRTKAGSDASQIFARFRKA